MHLHRMESGGTTADEVIAPDCRGLNFYTLDGSLQYLLRQHLAPDLFAHLEPHFRRLGELAGGRLDELATIADRHPPVLHQRDRFGRDEDWIEYHPAYREMERIAFEEFGLHAMSHRGGVLGWPEPIPPVAKYAFTYLFVQAEFGLMCPISLSDTAAYLVARYAEEGLKARYLPAMLSQEPDKLLKASHFMTEKGAGSDVGAIETVARREGGQWRLYGDKWFCSHADADIALLLARPEGAPAGTEGLGLFLMPRRLEDGRRNAYRIVRLKDKLGTRSMASGEILLEGAVAYPLGDLARGFKQMMETVNLSRLSHGVRAAAMMRRCLNEALVAARGRRAFGRPIIDMPLVRRQLLKLAVPTEQALSMWVWAAEAMEGARAGDAGAARLLRLLTPLVKFRACRDNIMVATGSMEIRGGNGYIEDFVNPRLVRDAQVGLLWEGTSNIVAQDAILRAIGKTGAEREFEAVLRERLERAEAAPEGLRRRLDEALSRAIALATRAAAANTEEGERLARLAAGGLYNAASAVLLAAEGAGIAASGGDARRLLYARLVLDHRLAAQDPLDPLDGDEAEFAEALLGESPLPLERARRLVAG